MRPSMGKMALWVALAANLMNGSFRAYHGLKNDSVAYRPKRQKFKGWQRQLREHK